MNLIAAFTLTFYFLSQDTTAVADTTGFGYKVGLYLGSFMPFILLLIIFLIIIRSSYRFKSRK